MATTNNSSTALSDLLQASGIMTSDNEGNSDSGSGTSSVGSAACRVGGGQHDNLVEGLNHRQPQQVLLQQRIPAEKCKTRFQPLLVLESLNTELPLSFMVCVTQNVFINAKETANLSSFLFSKNPHQFLCKYFSNTRNSFSSYSDISDNLLCT
jgi:hypothetical protein